jgi:tetratricopeptide (TPR) repeat protein
MGGPNAAANHYNLLVQGFRAGHLSLNKDVPIGLTQLADPYDPVANSSVRYGDSRLHDLSYYKGKLYLYFGVTPALALFWPYAAVTGQYLYHRQAVALFCMAGFLASVSVLIAVWRRYFTEVSAGVVAAGVIALGLVTGVLALLTRCYVYEVAISCGYMLVMLALGGIWRALQETERTWRWLAAASAAYGLAVGARPSLLFGAIILLVPVVKAWRERQRVWSLLVAAVGPIALIGLGLMLYNRLRFDSPFEFGLRYQLAMDRQHMLRPFSPSNLWFNFRLYFLEPVHWNRHFPFINEIAVPPVPAGHGRVEAPFGVLANVPLVWLALAVPLAWRDRPKEMRAVICWFLAAVVLLFVAGAVVINLYYYTAIRFEVEFLPALLLLAVIGILGVERTLAPTSESGQASRTSWRILARCGWGLLLGFSVASTLLATVVQCAEEHANLGTYYVMRGETEKAAAEFAAAVRLKPSFADAHENLAKLLAESGRTTEAIAEYEAALNINPDSADIHNDLGTVLAALGKFDAAIEQYRNALQINPELSDVHYNLAVALAEEGKTPEAITEYEAVIRIKPDPVTYNNLAITLLRIGRVPEAVEQYQQGVLLQPDDPELHYNLGNALVQLGKTHDAITQYEQALKLRPDFTVAREALARLNARAVPSQP